MPFPTPGDLPDPGIEPMTLASRALTGGFFTTVPLGKLLWLSKNLIHEQPTSYPTHALPPTSRDLKAMPCHPGLFHLP